MGFSWYYYTKEILTKEEIENSIEALQKFAGENSLGCQTLPRDAGYYGPEYMIYEGTYRKYGLGKVVPSNLRGIFVIFPEPSVSEAFDFVPNSQRCIARASCKTFAREPEDIMVEKMLRLLVKTTNGKLFATNDAFDLIGEPPEDWFELDNGISIVFPPTHGWSFHTKTTLEPQEIEDSMDKLTEFAHERNLRYVILPSSLEDLRKSKVVWSSLQSKGYTVAEGTDKASTPVNRNPLDIKGIVIRVNNIEFEFVPNRKGYIASSLFASRGNEVENQIAEEMLKILLRTTHDKLYAYLDSKDVKKVIGEIPEYHQRVGKK